jgi:beta-glucosidase
VGALHGPANPWFQARGYPGSAYVTEPATPLFPFGFGLSYTNYTLTNVAVQASGSQPLGPGDVFNVTLDVSSKGPAGALVVQVYFSQDPPTKYARYGRALLCFGKVQVPANAVQEPVVVQGCRVQVGVWL